MALHLTCKNKAPKLSNCRGCGDLEDRVETLENRTDIMREKLNTIEEGAEVNVQSDWAVNDTNSDAYIKNKPTIDTAMSATSTNAVQNRVIKAYVDSKGDKNFVHTQSTASATWEIIHGLNKYPAIMVTDSNNEVIQGEYVYNSADKVTLNFSEPITGKAIFN